MFMILSLFSQFHISVTLLRIMDNRKIGNQRNVVSVLGPASGGNVAHTSNQPNWLTGCSWHTEYSISVWVDQRIFCQVLFSIYSLNKRRCSDYNHTECILAQLLTVHERAHFPSNDSLYQGAAQLEQTDHSHHNS